MGIGGGSGGGGFKLEKTWRATGVGTTTFNTPGNFTIPFGKYDILVSGRAGTGNPDTPGNIASYNPIVPSTLAGYNSPTPSNVSGYNALSPGTGTGSYNPGSGGNFAGYTQSGGNIANYNSPTGGGFNVTEFVARYTAGSPGSPGNPTGSYNPGSGGNLAGYNTFVAGTDNYNPPTNSANYNPPIPGGTATIYITYVCEPAGAFPGFYVDASYYNSFYGVYDPAAFTNLQNTCPSPTTNFQTIPSSPGNIAGYNPPSSNVAGSNPPSGGNPNYNPVVAGTQNWNASSAPTPATYETFYFNNGYSTICPSPYSLSIPGSFENITYSCSPVPGSPGNANYNAVTNTPVFNAFVSGNQNYNAPTGGNAVWNAAIPGNAVWNAVGGQNANYNTPSGGVAGASTNVLGVFFPGGNVGAVAPFVSPTVINRYIADDTTYPVTVPTGGYVTIQSR